MLFLRHYILIGPLSFFALPSCPGGIGRQYCKATEPDFRETSIQWIAFALKFIMFESQVSDSGRIELCQNISFGIQSGN
jgi:hypothetical protein